MDAREHTFLINLDADLCPILVGSKVALPEYGWSGIAVGAGRNDAVLVSLDHCPYAIPTMVIADELRVVCDG